MRQETNNEMDLLLRRLSRRQGMPVSDADSDHLDADELSSYAENALPAAARARYTEHLAECSRCRELVVQLSASVPVMAVKETVTAAGPSGLRKFLASLFSPMGLRYAVPALALIIAGTIGFMMLRSRQAANSYVAQLEQRPTQQVPAAVPAEGQIKNYDSAARTAPQSPTVKSPVETDRPAKEAGPAVTHNEPPPAAVRADRVEPKIDAPVAQTERQAVANAEPTPAAAAPKPAETVDEMRVEVEGRKANVQGRTAAAGDLAKQKSSEGARDQEKKSEDTALAPASGKTRRGVQGAQTGGATSTLDMVDKREKDKDDGVIRTAGGRRFRKQGGFWVDTAYASGSAIVDVARGSEQYRALVADEPTIKTIADQLDGPFVVVWKGRTYRIR